MISSKTIKHTISYLSLFFLFTGFIQGQSLDSSSVMIYLPFNGGIADASPNEHDVILTGMASFVEGKYGQCWEFDGTSNDYLDIGYEGWLDPSKTSFTVCCWSLNMDVPASNPRVALAQRDGSTDKGRYFIATTGQDLDCYNNWLGGHHSYSSEGTLSRNYNEWVHVAVVCDREKQSVTYYFNGKKDTTVVGDPFESADGRLLVGRHKSHSGQGWLGLIDEVYVLNRTLSSEEIKRVMNNELGERQSTGMGNVRHLARIQVFPNPSRGKIYLKGLPVDHPYELEVLAVTGQMIHKEVNHTNGRIDLSHLGTGTFLLKISGPVFKDVIPIQLVR